MNDIHAVLGRAAWRLGVSRFLYGLMLAAMSALGAVIVLRLGEKLGNLVVRWDMVGWIAGGACILGAVGYALFTRPTSLAVAQRVDQGAGLKEALSTALCVAPAAGSDPWARVTVESASAEARQVRVASAVPVVAPRSWPMLVALGFATFIVFLAVPKYQLFKLPAALPAGGDAQAAVIEATSEKLEVQKLKELTNNLVEPKPEPTPPASANAEPKPPQTAEEIRRSAVKELSTLNDRLEQMRTGAQAQKLAQTQQKLQQLSTPGKDTAELSTALAKGDFSKAKAAIEKLQKSAGAGEGAGGMSKDQKKDVAKQLDDLAKQLDKLAAKQDQLAEKLAQAGIDPGLASDPAAMQKAIEQSKSLSDDQKQQLANAAEGMKQSQEAMKGLSQSMAQMAQSMQQSGQQSGQESGQEQGQQGDQQQGESAATQAGEQLSELEQIAQDMASASAAQSQVQEKMTEMAGKCDGGSQQGRDGGSDSPWSEGWNQGEGGRRGGGGIGQGGQATSAKADFEKVDKKSLGAVAEGPTVGTRLIEGDSIRGESRAQFAAVVARGEQAATEAIENNTLPREYHNAVKNYFGRLQQKASQPGTPAKDAAPATPAEPAKDAK
jgi:hypothetical protein